MKIALIFLSVLVLSPGSDNNIIRFKVNGAPVKTSVWNIAPFTGIKGITGINVTSNMHEDGRTVSFNINGNTVGTYPLKAGLRASGESGIAYGSYRPDYMKAMMNNYRFVSGEFVITSIDPKKHLFNCTFHGRATNGRGEAIEITDGAVINAELKPASH